MKIVIDNKEIELVIHYKNNKNLYIRARDEKTLEVTCNPFMTTKKIMKVIKENEPKNPRRKIARKLITKFL